MTKHLNVGTDTIGKPFRLPLDFVTKTVAILAQRRKGKTYTASVIAEELVEAGIPFVVLDPTGAWWGLRSSADGKHPGIPVVVLGGHHGDIPLERTGGALVADLVVQHPGWYVIDFSAFESATAERQFATDFAERLYRAKAKHDFPLHLLVDEADRFVPQRLGGKGGETDPRMLGAFEVIVRRGGLRGLGTTLISQRAAVVNKNVLEQIDMLIALRVVGPNDRAAIDDYVKSSGTPQQRSELMGSLSSLDIGQAWFWEPGGDPVLFDLVNIRERRTFNSSATPKVGEQRVEPEKFATVDLDAVSSAMADTIEKAKADDPKELRKQITALTRRITELEQSPAPDPEVREVEVIREVVPEAAKQAARQLAELLDGYTAPFATVSAKPVPAAPVAASTARLPAPPPPKLIAQPSHSADRLLPGPQRKLLTVLATYGPRTKRQLALQAGYSENGGGFNNPLGRLRSDGYVTKGAPIEITDAGLAALGDYDPLPTGTELLEHWVAQLPGPAAKILAAIAVRWPDGWTKDGLAAECGYSPIGGGFNNPQQLRRRVHVPPLRTVPVHLVRSRRTVTHMGDVTRAHLGDNATCRRVRHRRHRGRRLHQLQPLPRRIVVRVRQRLHRDRADPDDRQPSRVRPSTGVPDMSMAIVRVCMAIVAVACTIKLLQVMW